MRQNRARSTVKRCWWLWHIIRPSRRLEMRELRRSVPLSILERCPTDPVLHIDIERYTSYNRSVEEVLLLLRPPWPNSQLKPWRWSWVQTSRDSRDYLSMDSPSEFRCSRTIQNEGCPGKGGTQGGGEAKNFDTTTISFSSKHPGIFRSRTVVTRARHQS